MMSFSKKFDVAIAGAGPAGTSAAITLAQNGAHVLLVDEKKFPRAKLCGEFISPECLTHFKRLGVSDLITTAAGSPVSETVFYSRRGHNVRVPSEWFASAVSQPSLALGLSRSEMDFRLLQRAKDAGVRVIEGAHASAFTDEREVVKGVRLKSGESLHDYEAIVTIDATGRTRALSRHLDSRNLEKKRPGLVAFKAHLEQASVAAGCCEIYFYQGGYGGLSPIENGLTNLCFIVSAGDVRKLGSDPDRVVREVVMKNSRAAVSLANAKAITPWLSVSLEGFGCRSLTPATGLLTIGDAASFIDPFTGSGMLMALESGEVAARVVNQHLTQMRAENAFESIAAAYRREYTSRFQSRLRTSSLLRRAAFVHYLAEAAILLFGVSSRLRRKLARATRCSGRPAAGTSAG